MRHVPASFLLLLAAALPVQSHAAQELLRLDGFESGQPASFQAGFLNGEMGAVRLVPTIACPCNVEDVIFVYGGGTGTFRLAIHIWDDPGNLQPGTEIFSGFVDITGSNDSLQQVDLTPQNIVVNGPFRVGIELVEIDASGLPSLATDLDATVDASSNFLYAFDLFSLQYDWYYSTFFGLSGDWIIRATIDNDTPPSVPALSPMALAALGSVMFGAGVLFSRRPTRRG